MLCDKNVSFLYSNGGYTGIRFLKTLYTLNRRFTVCRLDLTKGYASGPVLSSVPRETSLVMRSFPEDAALYAPLDHLPLEASRVAGI